MRRSLCRLLWLLTLAWSMSVIYSDDDIVDDTHVADGPDWDDKGYIMFCPCMGRFGDQLEQFLGALAFAKAVDRTLVLPRFRDHRNWVSKTVSFPDWFQVDVLRQFHKVIIMEDFLAYFGEDKWASDNRRGYCSNPNRADNQCQMKLGNPAKSYWDEMDIDFDDIVRYRLSCKVDVSDKALMKELARKWEMGYPPSEHPVLVFSVAPGAFPVAAGNRQLQKYLKWNPDLFSVAENEMNRLFHGEKFVAIHLRTRSAWVTVCSAAEGREQYFASPQCIPSSFRKTISLDMCYPTSEEVVAQTTEAVELYDAKHLYIATDEITYMRELEAALGPLGVKVHHLDPVVTQIDVIILSQADFFIGNCVSTFTAFIKRDRDINGKPSTFWGFPAGGLVA